MEVAVAYVTAFEAAASPLKAELVVPVNRIVASKLTPTELGVAVGTAVGVATGIVVGVATGVVVGDATGVPLGSPVQGSGTVGAAVGPVGVTSVNILDSEI